MNNSKTDEFKIKINESNLLTYADLENAYTETLKAENKHNQIIKNMRCTLNSWLRTFNLKKESNLGSEILNNFHKNIILYKKCEKENQIKPSTYNSRASILKDIQIFLNSKIKQKEMPETFSERLKFLLKTKGFSVKKLADSLNIPQNREVKIRLWLRGKIPRFMSYEEIKKIEKIFGVSEGTLLSTLPLQTDINNKSYPEVKFRERQKFAAKERYTKWNRFTEQEFQDLVEYKTSIIPPNGLKRYKNTNWTKHDDGEIPTANIVKSSLSSFFGYCCLDKNSTNPRLKGAGMKEDSLTIALLTDVSLVEGYINFKIRRSEEKYNGWHITFLSKVTSFLRKETGYLYQKPEFAKKLGQSLTKSEWHERCLDTRTHLIQLINKIIEAKKSNSYGYLRDPSEPIQEILEKANPLEITLTMTEGILNDAEKYEENSLQRAIIYRNALLIAILQANPLRARMFSIMKINKNLVKENGTWWLKFDRNEFKNNKNLKSNYTVRLSEQIYFLIEKYLTKYRPRILRSAESEYVFVNSNKVSIINENGRLKVASISRMVIKYTRKYLKNSPGFGPHSFRHIVATSVIKNDPIKGFYLAAKALNDKIETIEENYAHLKTSELFEPYNDFFRENWKKVVEENPVHETDNGE